MSRLTKGALQEEEWRMEGGRQPAGEWKMPYSNAAETINWQKGGAGWQVNPRQVYRQNRMPMYGDSAGGTWVEDPQSANEGYWENDYGAGGWRPPSARDMGVESQIVWQVPEKLEGKKE